MEAEHRGTLTLNNTQTKSTFLQKIPNEEIQGDKKEPIRLSVPPDFRSPPASTLS